MPTFSIVSAGREHWKPYDGPQIGISAWRREAMDE